MIIKQAQKKDNMTRSFGGGPDRPRQDKKPEPRDDQPGFESRLDSFAKYGADEETTVQPVRVDFSKRLVAGMIDMAAAYVISMAINLVPFANVFVTSNLVMVLVLLVRDYFFEGRGVGKNCMGLQVVDIKTGLQCSLLQAVKRNIVLFGPLIILFVMALIMHIMTSLLHLPEAVDAAVFEVINTIGMIYTIIVIPYEAYRVYSRADGRRFGDQFAGTAVIEAHTDFSKPVARQ